MLLIIPSSGMLPYCYCYTPSRGHNEPSHKKGTWLSCGQIWAHTHTSLTSKVEGALPSCPPTMVGRKPKMSSMVWSIVLSDSNWLASSSRLARRMSSNRLCRSLAASSSFRLSCADRKAWAEHRKSGKRQEKKLNQAPVKRIQRPLTLRQKNSRVFPIIM